MPYRPASGSVISFSSSPWSCAGKPDVAVTVRFDARLICWLVNRAARRATAQYQINEGKPPITIHLDAI